MISRKGVTIHWSYIVTLIVLVVGVILLLVFVFKVGEVGKSFIGPLIDAFQGVLCKIVGGFIGWAFGLRC